MRTPGQDVDLAVGFLHGEGIVRSREDIADVRPCGPTGNIIKVELAPGVTVEEISERTGAPVRVPVGV